MNSLLQWGMASLLKDRLQRALDAGYSNAQIAAAVGVTTGAVSQWKSGETQSLRATSAAALARLTGWSAQWWATGKGPQIDHSHRVHEPVQAYRPAPSRSLADLVADLADALESLPEDQRRLAIDNFSAVARDPKLKAARGALVVALTPDSLGESGSHPAMSRRKRTG